MDTNYDRKFEEMKKYIPFLKCMIKRLESTGTTLANRRKLAKIRSLRDLLLDKKKRMKMVNLLKCEQVLVNLYAEVEQRDSFTDTKSDMNKSLNTQNIQLDFVKNKLKTVTSKFQDLEKLSGSDNATKPESSLQSKISVIEQESFKEKFAYNIIENFSNNSVSNSDDNIISPQTTVISDIDKDEEVFEQDKINHETKSGDITSSESKKTLTKISDACTKVINPSNKNGNHDKNISQCYEILNLCQCKPVDLSHKYINKVEVNLAEISGSVAQNACFNDKGVTNLNDKVTESDTENVKINDSETEVPNNSQIVDMLENFKEQNDDNVFRVVPNNCKNLKSVCSILNTKGCNSAAQRTLTAKDIEAIAEQNEAYSKSTTRIISETNLKTACVKNCNEANNVYESHLDGEQGVEVNNIDLKIVHQSKTQVDESKKNNVVKGNKKIDEKKIEVKKKSTLICKLSNTLYILSNDEDEQLEVSKSIPKPNNSEQCINIEDDDDIMLIDEDICAKKDSISQNSHTGKILEQSDTSICYKNIYPNENMNKKIDIKYESATEKIVPNLEKNNMCNENKDLKNLNMRPILPCYFLKTLKKNLADMAREDLEELFILKFVERFVDRSSLENIKSHLRTMALTVGKYKKKAMMLTKQNRDLQVVLTSIQEEQKKAPITPPKITRSVGMQVLMTDKPIIKRKIRKERKGTNSNPTSNCYIVTEMLTSNTLEKSQKSSSQQIPVPKLVPVANNIATKLNIMTQTNTIAPGKPQQTNNTLRKSVSNSSPTQKPEKRLRQLSVTVNLTDDEPPTKMASRSSPVLPVRFVPPQNLMAPRYPAPLPEATKQYQPPNWKALPPPPNLKLSKVENGIIISWKIDGYQDDSYEEIASYQLYAYLETTSPPSTELWKKIGDVKAKSIYLKEKVHNYVSLPYLRGISLL